MPPAGSLGTTVPVTELVDASLWRDRYAHGIALGQGGDVTELLRAAGGNVNVLLRLLTELPLDTIAWHLRAAVSQLEVKIGRPLTTTRVRTVPIDPGMVRGRDYDLQGQLLPYRQAQQEQWIRIDLPGGVVSVERVRAYYFGTHVWEWSPERGDMDQVLLEWGKQGIMHIIPKEFQLIWVSNGTMATLELMAATRRPIPGFWSVDYTLGPVAEWGGPAQIEAVFAEWVYCTAGAMIFALAGMIKAGGLTNTSISMDGISESIGLSAGGGNGLYGAWETAMKERAKSIDIARLVSFKRGLRPRNLGP